MRPNEQVHLVMLELGSCFVYRLRQNCSADWILVLKSNIFLCLMQRLLLYT